jgi:hypothetical protein
MTRRAIPNQIARAIARRRPQATVTAVVVAFDLGGATVDLDMRGSVIYGVRYQSSYVPAVNDVVVVQRDTRGLIATGKIGVSAGPVGDTGSSGLYLDPSWTHPPLFTGTWRDGMYRNDVNNECQFGEILGKPSMGVAYYGRVLQGSYVYTSDSYFLNIVRLPSPGHVPAQVRICLLEGQAPVPGVAPVVLDSVDRALTGPGMGDYAEGLSMQAQGWETRFMSGEAGGIGLQKVPAEPDHLTRVAGSLGLSMTVTGYPAWVL